MAPFTVHAHGHVEGTTQDQSIIGGDFHDLFGGAGFKMLAGERAQLTLDNGSGDPSSTSVAFDALRFVWVDELGTLAWARPASTAASARATSSAVPAAASTTA